MTAQRKIVLLHGLGGDGSMWPAEEFAGFQVIRPDFRGHGRNAKPHDEAAYPPDVLTDDILALVDGLGDNDLGGYSLGARIVIGADDERAASGPQLAGALPHGSYAKVPGDHGTAATSPELFEAMREFLK
jgi:predicted alpha/beta-fold hydrolase